YLNEMEGLRDKNLVFIFDECHRSQFGQTHTKIVKFFKKAQMIGFTGTPILDENSIGKRTTKELFDKCLHKYLIPDAFGDHNVLGFVVDYLTTKEVTTLENELRVLEKDNKTKNKEEIKSLKVRIKEILESSERIEGITKHIIANHSTYTNNKFTAMMTVDSVDMLMEYYDSFKAKEHNLKIATIFSYSTTEESSDDIEDGNGASVDENNIDMVRKEKLEGYIADYNSMFDTNYSTDTKEYYNYYDDIADRVKNQEIDLLIVVNMFLTGFDAPRLNTLYVDKQLKHHGLIQAFSRTNRIYTGKEHGKIICFRDLQSKVEEAIKLFSDGDVSSTLLRDNYETYLEKFNEQLVLLREIAKTPDEVKYLKTKQSKLEFVETFRKLLTQLDTMKTFIEFEWDTLEITAQEINDYTSHYLDIYYDMKDGDTGEGENEDSESSDLSEVDFSLDLISRDVIDLLYILKLLFNLDDDDDKQRMNIYNIIRATPNLYRKKEIIEEFIKYFKASNGSIDNIDEEYTKFSNAKKEKEIDLFCQEHKLDNIGLEKLISKYLYDAKEIKSDDVVTLFTYKLKIMERKKLVPIVQKLIMGLIYKFEEM
ncbi:MAG TPA: type I restriction endonuclease subunit R, partial [Arcobacter sp.]|nr:type I restriction endonuclease subunit R [Arcobacter sp.]